MDAQSARPLRLDELLHELGARPAGTAPPETRPAHLTVGELVDKAAEAGFGFLVGILTLIAIPFFGLSTPFGLAIALIGVQMVIGRAHPWLPKRARRRELKMEMLDRVTTLLATRARWVARATRRRYELLVRPRLIGFGIVLLALGLALPLPIPGSNLVFLIPLFVYAVALLEGDGLWVVIGHVLVVTDLVLLAAFGTTVVAAIAKVWSWIT